MSLTLHIPHWLLWMALGFVIGWVACYVRMMLGFANAVGSAFGW